MKTRVVEWAILIFASIIFNVECRIYFKEDFAEGWETRWRKSNWKAEQQGKWVTSKGKWYGDEQLAPGIQTTEANKFYELTSRLEYPISTKAGPLIVQYSVKFEQVIDCGGGYIKLLGEKYAAAQFGGETPFIIMFGPDICGSDNNIRLVLDYSGKGQQWKKIHAAPNDKLTHIYTFVLYPNAFYAVYLDAQILDNGTVSEDWDMGIPRTIPDPADKKPAVY